MRNETCRYHKSSATCRNGEPEVLGGGPSLDTGKTDVSVGVTKGFGAGALKINGKIFAMSSSKGEFVVKLPENRIDELLASGLGKRYEPRPSRVMKQWFALKDEGAGSIELAKEARGSVNRGRS